MQEQIKKYLNDFRTERKKMLLVAISTIALVLGGVAIASGSSMPTNEAHQLVATDAPSGRIDVLRPNALPPDASSWPGEIIALDTVSIQPPREGTLSSWDVHIGEKVAKGQVLGRLSPPPQMPDILAMVADAASMSAMARAELAAKEIYTTKRMAELLALRNKTEVSGVASNVYLSGQESGGMITLRRENLRGILRGSLITTYPMVSGSLILPTRWQDYRLIDPIGAQHSKLRDQFQSVFFATLTEVNDPTKIPERSGREYYSALTELIDATIPDGAMVTASDLLTLKTMVHKDQNEFLMALDALREAELEGADKNKMLASDLSMIEQDIAMLNRDLAEARGNLIAKEVAEASIRHAVLGDALIVAPQSGVISSVMKRPGEFVGPGMPVAIVSRGSEPLVRFRLPNNTQRPTPGEIVTVTRTGFAHEGYTATVIGVGAALDETGSIMADAKLTKPTDWPIGTSVRVIPEGARDSLAIKLSGVKWTETKEPFVWAITEGGRVYRQKVTLGRMLGQEVEVYAGLRDIDQYIGNPNSEIREDMLIQDLQVDSWEAIKNPAPMDHGSMPGMEM